jgi:hypothetical protein
MTDPQQKKYLVTTSHWTGKENERTSRHFEVNAQHADISEFASTGADPCLVFTNDGEGAPDEMVAGFASWDRFWADGAVTEVQPMPAQIVNALETAPDDFEPRARPTRHDRG